jgi:hypothetical protein
MLTFLHNRYVHHIGILLAPMIEGLVVLFAGNNLLGSSTGLFSNCTGFVPSTEMSF